MDRSTPLLRRLPRMAVPVGLLLEDRADVPLVLRRRTGAARRERHDRAPEKDRHEAKPRAFPRPAGPRPRGPTGAGASRARGFRRRLAHRPAGRHRSRTHRRLLARSKSSSVAAPLPASRASRHGRPRPAFRSGQGRSMASRPNRPHGRTSSITMRRRYEVTWPESSADDRVQVACREGLDPADQQGAEDHPRDAVEIPR